MPPEQKPRKSHRMPHQPKRPRILRPRTAGRHCVAQPLTRPPAQRPHPPAPPQAGPDQRTPPTRDAMHRFHAPMPLSRPLPRTHVAPAHPAHRNDPNTHVQACTHHVPGNKPFCIRQPRAHDSGSKIAASAHGMGSGGSAVDAMVIGCLGVERRAERFLSYLAIFAWNHIQSDWDL